MRPRLPHTEKWPLLQENWDHILGPNFGKKPPLQVKESEAAHRLGFLLGCLVLQIEKLLFLQKKSGTADSNKETATPAEKSGAVYYYKLRKSPPEGQEK